MKTFLIFLLFSVILVSCKNKQAPQMENTAENTNEAKTSTSNTGIVIDATKDAEYVVDSYANALYAIRASEIIQQKTTRNDIKSMAANIAATNKKVFSQLDQLASAKKISLPSNLNMSQITDLNKLANETVNSEKLFIQQMENEHREGMVLLEKISKESEDNEITTVAISCLASVKTQYDEVVATKERLDL